MIFFFFLPGTLAVCVLFMAMMNGFLILMTSTIHLNFVLNVICRCGVERGFLASERYL